jgi:hypothetical protein
MSKNITTLKSRAHLDLSTTTRNEYLAFCQSFFSLYNMLVEAKLQTIIGTNAAQRLPVEKEASSE